MSLLGVAAGPRSGDLSRIPCSDQINRGLIQFRAQLIALICACDVGRRQFVPELCLRATMPETEGYPMQNGSVKTLELFQSYGWPGNIRELQNVIERSVILTAGNTSQWMSLGS
jgi:hypothetical protein